MEVRAGTLIVKNRANISVPREVASFAAANGSGTTVFGAAIAVSQHYTDQKIPINVVIEDAVLDADTSLYQVDTKPTDTAHKVDVSITINDGKFQGGTQDIRIDDLRKEEIKNFIGGGEFDVQPDPSYVATTSTVLQVGDEYFVVPLATTDVEKAQQEADDYVRLYAASKNVEYTDDIRSLIYSAEVTTLDDVYVRRSVAISMVDNKYEQLKTAKLTAIERITAASAAKEATDTQEAQAAVVVPTSTLAAINAAINENQVAEFERNAIAEIEDIRAYRKEIADLIGTNCAEVLDAIKAFRETLLGDGTEANVGKLAQVQTELEAKIKAVQDKVDTLATSDELSAAKNDLTASIETAVSTLTGKIDEVKTVANSNATALENLGVDVSDVKTAIAAIDAVDAATLQEKLTALQMAIATAVSTAQTQLTEKIEALDAKMNTLTGRVNEVNSGLASEIDELDAKIAKLGTFSDNSLEAELGEIDAKLVAIASKVSAAVNVESEKSRASERIQNILNGLIGVEEAGGESPAAEQSAASNGLTDTEREKLHEVYSDKIATLIEQYYNEAIDGVANATTAEEAHSAADNFKRNVDTAKMIDSLGSKEQASLQPIYALLIIAVVLAVVAIILTIAFHAKKKSKE